MPFVSGKESTCDYWVIPFKIFNCLPKLSGATPMPPEKFDIPLFLRDAIILIADDDDGHASLLERNLKRCGITAPCSRFSDGQEVLDFLLKVSKSMQHNSPPFHLLFLDGRMPTMSGQEVLKHIQTHRALQTLPLCIVGTTDDAQELASFRALGCRYFLHKPVDLAALQRLFHQLQLEKPSFL